MSGMLRQNGLQRTAITFFLRDLHIRTNTKSFYVILMLPGMKYLHLLMISDVILQYIGMYLDKEYLKVNHCFFSSYQTSKYQYGTNKYF